MEHKVRKKYLFVGNAAKKNAVVAKKIAVRASYFKICFNIIWYKIMRSYYEYA